MSVFDYISKKYVLDKFSKIKYFYPCFGSLRQAVFSFKSFWSQFQQLFHIILLNILLTVWKQYH